jgi:hypothetical protein
MRLYNSIKFLFTFIIIGFISGFVCLIYGTEKALISLKRNGIILTNDKKQRNEK